MKDIDAKDSSTLATNEDTLTHLSHDIRSAVSDIIGGLRLVEQSNLDKASRLQLERVRTASEGLARLTEEALAIVGHGFSNQIGHASTVHLHRLLNDIELRWSGRAREKGLDFKLGIQTNVPTVGLIDRLAFERILTNLLSNSIKYTETGLISLRVDVQTDGALRVVVSDTGPGFSEQALSRLFTQHGRPEGAGKPGTGLGLHIAKDLADRMDASLSVSGNGSSGTEVTLRLPSMAWQFTREDNGDQDLPDLSHIKVLVAEDSETNQQILGQMLAAMGAEYEIAPDGVEALNWLSRESFDIALVDIDMPRLTGLEVMRAVRQGRGPQAKMPILAVTSYVLRSNREEIFAAGANGVLAKPVLGIDVFGHTIASILGLLPVQLAPSDPATDALISDTARFHRLMELSGPTGAIELLTRLGNDLENVSLRLARAFEVNDPDTVRAQCHVLVSLAGAVGAERVQKLAEVLNSAAHRDDLGAIDTLGFETLHRLKHLIALIAAERQQREGPGTT